MTSPRCRLIYNPHAGAKRSKFSLRRRHVTLEDIVECLNRYDIFPEISPTTGPQDATRLARDAAAQGFNMVIVAGGDGTVGEAANGLVGTETKLAVLPMGTFMNVARMLGIPFSLEGAVSMIRIGRFARIDVGCVTRESGETLSEPYYFLESAGIGLDAQLQELIHQWEHGDIRALWRAWRTFWDTQQKTMSLTADDRRIDVRATFVSVANGPYMGPAVKATPESKLDDHQLTVSLIQTHRFRLLKYAYDLMYAKRGSRKNIKQFKTKTLTVKAASALSVHADARLFGETPAQFTILPRALSVICGFPKPEESALRQKSYIDP